MVCTVAATLFAVASGVPAGVAGAAAYTYRGEISNPGAVATAPEGGASAGPWRYIADQGANRIVKLNAAGALTVVNDSYNWGSPRDIDVDGAHLWVIDTLRNKLVELSTSGAVQHEFGTAGEYKAAEGVAADASGVFVADTYHHRIVKVDKSTGREIWSVSQCAGTPLSRVRDVDVGAGSVVGVDTDNNRIVVLDAGTASCRAFGHLGTGAGEFSQPRALAYDNAGGVYVTESGTNRLQHVRLDGSPIAETASDVFNSPHGVFLDGAAVDVCDTFNYRIVRYNAALTSHSIFFSARVAPYGFAGAESVAYGPDGSIYAVDIGNLRVEKFTPAGKWVKTIGGNGTGNGEFQFLRGITVSTNGTVVVTDSENSRIQLFDRNLKFLRVVKPNNTKLLRPHYSVLLSDGSFWVTDTYNDRVVHLNPAGQLVSSFASGLVKPQGLAVDGAGDLYIANTGKNTVEKRSPSGSVLDTLATAGGGATQVRMPNGLALDGSTLYVADSGNDRILVLTTSGGAVASFGSTGSSGPHFDDPRGVDAQGSKVAVADYGNNRIALWAH